MSPQEKKPVEVPEKFKSVVEHIEKLSVLELSELVKVLEDHFGVSAAPAVLSAVAPAGAGADTALEEKTSFNVELTSAGTNKIAAIKVVREATGKGLKDAKDLVDAAPKIIKEGATKEEADDLKSKLEAAGALVKVS